MPPIPSPNPPPPSFVTPLTPAPQPQPAPAPQPAVAPQSSLNIGLVIVATCLAMMTAMMGLAFIVGLVVYFGGFWPHPGPPSPVAIDFKALGAEYAAELGPSYAPAWKGFAADLRNGKPLADATKTVNDVWSKNREAIFKAKLQPALSSLIPDGTTEDKVTPAQRAAMAKAAEDLAEGLGGTP